MLDIGLNWKKNNNDMKQVCILCDNSVIEEVRKTGKLMGTDILKIGVSKRGNDPATHWFCKMSMTDDDFSTILNQRKKLISDGKYFIEETNEKEFLEKYNLKRIS